MKKLALILLVALPLAARTRSVRQIVTPWQQPQCAEISGMPWVRYIDAADQVHRVAPAQEQLFFRRGTPEPNAIAAATAANVLFATMTDGSILESYDAGCSWQLHAKLPEVLRESDEPRILAQHLSRVYVHTLTKIVRLTHATVETFAFEEPMLHVDVDPKDANHLRGIAKYGSVFESRDGAATWTRIGSLGVFTLVSAVATDPKDFDHVLAAPAAADMLTSDDGGRTWTPRALGRKIVHDVAFSPADPSIVWLDAYDARTNAAGLYVSSDRGITFRLIDQATTRLGFTYGTLAPHPTNARLISVAPGLGTSVYTPDGLQSRIIADNVRQVIWSPAGTMYYLVNVIRML